jgi:hypothetical protein
VGLLRQPGLTQHQNFAARTHLEAQVVVVEQDDDAGKKHGQGDLQGLPEGFQVASVAPEASAEEGAVCGVSRACVRACVRAVGVRMRRATPKPKHTLT